MKNWHMQAIRRVIEQEIVHCMPACNNCGGFVTDQYARVFAPPKVRGVRVCPQCEDKLRDGAEVREANSPRHTNG